MLWNFVIWSVLAMTVVIAGPPTIRDVYGWFRELSKKEKAR